MYEDYNNRHFSDMLGEVFSKIDTDGKTFIRFISEKGWSYLMHHDQSCCETVEIQDINGDLNDLIGSPIVLCEENINQENPPQKDWVDCFTWTFYRLATIKGFVVIRWLGESNGWYSERVDLSFEPRGTYESSQ